MKSLVARLSERAEQYRQVAMWEHKQRGDAGSFLRLLEDATLLEEASEALAKAQSQLARAHEMGS